MAESWPDTSHPISGHCLSNSKTSTRFSGEPEGAQRRHPVPILAPGSPWRGCRGRRAKDTSGSSLTAPPCPMQGDSHKLDFRNDLLPCLPGPYGALPTGQELSHPAASLFTATGESGQPSWGLRFPYIPQDPPHAHSASSESPTSLPQVPSTLQPTPSRQPPGPMDPF